MKIARIAILASMSMLQYALAAAASPEQAIRDTLDAYEKAWTRHDAHAVAEFYHEPALRVSRGGPTVRATRADQEAFFDAFLRGMLDRGFATSALEELAVRFLDARTAIASGVAARYRADGTVLERVAVTYGLTDTADGWKIFMSATHAADTALHFK